MRASLSLLVLLRLSWFPRDRVEGSSTHLAVVHVVVVVKLAV
jgi:hypothetical protein